MANSSFSITYTGDHWDHLPSEEVVRLAKEEIRKELDKAECTGLFVEAIGKRLERFVINLDGGEDQDEDSPELERFGNS
jgi:hypothetical protein